jgi:hypothetical protein
VHLWKLTLDVRRDWGLISEGLGGDDSCEEKYEESLPNIGNDRPLFFIDSNT